MNSNQKFKLQLEELRNAMNTPRTELDEEERREMTAYDDFHDTCRDRIRLLESDVENGNAQKRQYVKTIQELEQEVERLKAERDRYRQALDKYGAHTNLCPQYNTWQLDSSDCTCGLDKALRGE